jgi:coenzyme F420-0:L-glutamate ligase/coenzyme F420-1:gamma-L-glutamate ligase
VESTTDLSLIDLFRSRRSLRRYKPQVIPEDILRQVLNAAIWSPSAHNRQPWRFCVIQSEKVKEQLARSMGRRLRADLEASHVPTAVIEKDVARSYERITSAPVAILLALSMVDMDIYPDEERNRNEYMMAVQSTAMAGQNLLLAAHSLRLGACWMCAPLFCQDVVCQALDLPDDWQPQALITMGYPAQERTKTRRALEKSVIWR